MVVEISSRHSHRTVSVAAVVVFYEPIPEYLNNLASYVDEVGHTWIVDNSTVDHSAWLSSSVSNVSYIWLGHNYGIALALNEGCRLAKIAGYDYILTMDQDSFFDSRQIRQHLDEACEVLRDDMVAIVAPGLDEDRAINVPALSERNSVITSGNLLSLKVWSAIDGFDVKLFIDQVDHEFCIRLRKQGYRIFVNRTIDMHHKVGDPFEGKFFGLRIRSSNHSWVRRYYHMRNTLYLRHKYPEHAQPLKLFLRDILVRCLGIILLEQEAGLKLKAMVLGAWDFFKGRYGAWDSIRPSKK